jgi:NAD(P)-dependent dehydrogenase (short-subunit alcohol dehydrogenase family)
MDQATATDLPAVASTLGVDRLFAVDGKVAVVTGGSRGIGRMIAAGLLANGATVHLVARNEEEVGATVEGLEGTGSAHACVADVATPEGRAAVAEAVAGHGRLDILVNNAGAAIAEPLGHAGPDAAAAMFGLNVTAPFLLTQELLPLLRAAAGPEDPARVVMVGSVDGLRVPFAPLFSYGASKAALHTLTRELAHALAGDNVTVNAIAPGMFESRMTERMLAAPGMRERIESGIPVGRIGSAEDIAGAVLYLCSRAGNYLTGAVIPIDGGVSTHG